MADGVLYFTAGQRRNVIAVNAGTGETLWLWRPDEGERFDRAPRKVGRGVAYWTDGTNARIITVTPGFQLVALDAKTGIPVRGFGQDGVVDLFKQLDLTIADDPIGKIGNSSAPVVSNDVIVIGPALTQGGTSPNKENVKGDILAFDVRTGKKLWIFHTIPRKGEPGYETWLNGSAEYTGNVGAWGPMSADPELGYVYIATESPTNDGYGGHRPGANLYSDSLVCLDIKTGKMIWYKQLIHHDIWDYDMPVHPILIDINVDGRPIKAVVQMGKMAFAYVLDRTNGRPVWPIPDVPVPQTDVPTEWTSPTQPIPTKPPAFDVVGRQGRRSDQLHGGSPQRGASGCRGLSHGGRVRAAVPGRAEWEQGNDRGAWLRWRRQLAIGRGGSRDRVRLCRIGHQTVRCRCGENRSARSQPGGLHGGPGRSRAECSRITVVEASLWPNHRVRHEQG